MQDIKLRDVSAGPPSGLEPQFCNVMDAAPVMIWVSGPDKGCIWFNRPWLLFTGRSIEQELGNGWADGVLSDDLHNCLQVYTSSFDTRKEFRMQYRLRCYDGAYRWVDDIGAPRHAPTGEFLGFIGSCLDISHLKSAEAALLESETRLRFALDAARMGTFEADLAGTEAIIDAQEARLLGLPEEMRVVSTEQLRRCIPIEDLTTSDAKQERLTRQGVPYQHEFCFRMPAAPSVG
jgi:PAS domain S-box-containing protein